MHMYTNSFTVIYLCIYIYTQQVRPFNYGPLNKIPLVQLETARVSPDKSQQQAEKNLSKTNSY